MTTLNVTRSVFDHIDEGDAMVCVFCDTLTDLLYCRGCEDYKGLMTIQDWEEYTGETWEE